MNSELMTELLALPRGRWMVLRQGLPAALSAALGDEYTNHTRIDTPEGPLRVLRMGRVRVADRGGSYDVYALCNMRQAPANPYWDELGRLVVDKDTRLVELDRPQAVTPMAAWGSEREREETLAELRELKAEREALLARATEGRGQANRDVLDAMSSLEEELDELRTDNNVARDLVAMAVREVESWSSRSGRVVASLLSSALKSLDGERE
jgi:hypothetical protein